MAKLSELYGDDISDFEELLSDASAAASTQWEMDFVEELEERYEIYGVDMFLSDKQSDVLERIANQ
jgi:hypothetical protein